MGLTSLWDHIYKIFRFHGWCPTISKMSNSSLRCVQSTAETPNHSEKAENISTGWTGLTGRLRIHRCSIIGAIGLAMLRPRGESQVAPDTPVISSLRFRCKHHTITQRRCRAMENRWFRTGYTSASPEQCTGAISRKLRRKGCNAWG